MKALGERLREGTCNICLITATRRPYRGAKCRAHSPRALAAMIDLLGQGLTDTGSSISVSSGRDAAQVRGEISRLVPGRIADGFSWLDGLHSAPANSWIGLTTVTLAAAGLKTPCSSGCCGAQLTCVDVVSSPFWLSKGYICHALSWISKGSIYPRIRDAGSQICSAYLASCPRSGTWRSPQPSARTSH